MSSKVVKINYNQNLQNSTIPCLNLDAQLSLPKQEIVFIIVAIVLPGDTILHEILSVVIIVF